MLSRFKIIFILFFTLALSACVKYSANGNKPGVTKMASSPTSPISFTKNTVFTQVDNGVTSYVYVPNSYDSTHQTPTKLFVWLHGCGGYAANDAGMVSYMNNQDWISLAIGGREGGCWSDVGTDGGKITAAMASIKAHFNIDPLRVTLGGYSSGGDIGYPYLFQNAAQFNGGLFENTGPDSSALAAAKTASWKLNITHVAHLSDTVYPIASARTEMATLKSDGFNVTLIEKAGDHWDNDNGAFGTTYDLRTFLLPLLATDGWVAPAGTTGVTDASMPVVDSSVPDTSVPVKDASAPVVDSSVPAKDASAPVVDASAPVDAGTPKVWALYAGATVFERDNNHVCVFFFVRNTTSVPAKWTALTLNSYQGTLYNHWFTNVDQKDGSKGSMTFHPVTVPTIPANYTLNVGGACFYENSSVATPLITGISQP